MSMETQANKYKFRAWNAIVQRYEYFDLKTLADLDEPVQWHILEIDQWTGLCDANGKGIYSMML